MKPEGLLLRSQEPVTGLYHEPNNMFKSKALYKISQHAFMV